MAADGKIRIIFQGQDEHTLLNVNLSSSWWWWWWWWWIGGQQWQWPSSETKGIGFKRQTVVWSPMILSLLSRLCEILVSCGLPRAALQYVISEWSCFVLCYLCCSAVICRCRCVSSSCELGARHHNSISWRKAPWSRSNCHRLQRALQNFPLLQTFPMQRSKNSFLCNFS